MAAGQARPDRRGQQRMAEPGAPVGHLDDAGLLGQREPVELLGRGQHGPDDVDRGLHHRRHDGQRGAGRRRQGFDPADHQLAQVVRDRQLITGGRLPARAGQHTGDLQGVEGISFARALDVTQRRPGQRQPGPDPDQVVQGAQAQPAEPDPDQPVRRQRPIEPPRHDDTMIIAERGQHTDRFVGQPSHDVLDDRRRGLVEPLRVVDRDHDRCGPRDRPDELEHADPDRSVVRHQLIAVGPQQRDLEGAALRRGQRGQGLLGQPVEQIAQSHEGEHRLGLGRPADQQPIAEALGGRDRLAPHRGLADAGRAVDETADRTFPDRGDGCGGGGEFALSSHHRRRCQASLPHGSPPQPARLADVISRTSMSDPNATEPCGPILRRCRSACPGFAAGTGTPAADGGTVER
jgi:hypothetical protein